MHSSTFFWRLRARRNSLFLEGHAWRMAVAWRMAQAQCTASAQHSWALTWSHAVRSSASHVSVILLFLGPHAGRAVLWAHHGAIMRGSLIRASGWVRQFTGPNIASGGCAIIWALHPRTVCNAWQFQGRGPPSMRLQAPATASVQGRTLPDLKPFLMDPSYRKSLAKRPPARPGNPNSVPGAPRPSRVNKTT